MSNRAVLTATAMILTLGLATSSAHAEGALRFPTGKLSAAARGALDDAHMVGLAVGIVHDGKVKYLKGFGYADMEAGVKVDPKRTMFRWASISKPVTASIALRLAAEGRVSLDAPISKWYPAFKRPTEYYTKCKKRAKTVEVDGVDRKCTKGYALAPLPPGDHHPTLRRLLSHTAGIVGYGHTLIKPTPKGRDTKRASTNTGLEWAVQKFTTSPLVEVPGRSKVYSSYGYNLLAVVLERAAETPFFELVSREVSKPAGLKTLQPDYEWVKIPRRATGYRWSKKKKDYDITRSSDVSWKLAAGGLISTTEDLARFCGALMSDQVLTRAQRLEAWAPTPLSGGETSNYGLGFSVSERNGVPFVQHTGVQPKARTRMRLFPDDGLCIVMMSNTSTADTEPLVDELEDIMRGAR